MITKNAGKLTKSYFKSYMQLAMSAREFSLDEAKAFAFKELFQNDEKKNGSASYENFQKAYKEMADDQDSAL